MEGTSSIDEDDDNNSYYDRDDEDAAAAASASASASAHEHHPPRLSPEERLRQYKPGSILRVKLKNFLTYADVEFRPGPRLNVVCGPNGTGKSTILCAICLGLGGQPPLLGRADDARTFIKNDEQIAEIEIELAPISNSKSNSNSNDTHTIRRVIDRNKGSERGRGIAASTYYINNEKCNIKTVQKLVSETYRIAIDNLCTFLPQDRVGSFSGFDAVMLLKETEKSVSSTQHLYDTHQLLIQLEEEIKESDTNLHSIKDGVDKLELEVGRLEREKELMERRERYMKEIQLLKQKHVWMRFDTKREEAIELKDKKKELSVSVKAAREKIRPVEEAIAQVAHDLERNVVRRNELEKGMGHSLRKFNDGTLKAEKYNDEIENNKVDLTEIDTKHRRLLGHVEDCRRKKEQYESQLREYPPEQELIDAFDAAREEQRHLREKLRLVKSDLVELQQTYKDRKEELEQAENTFTRMQDEKARRNEKILSQDPALAKAYQWVNQNRKMFRRQVWGPIVCDITTRDVNASNCLEQHVRNAVLNSFVVECMEDYRLLYREVREKNKIPVNIQVVHNGKLNPIKRKYSDQKMDTLRREHGVQGYLDEVFKAPDPILQALINTSNIQSVLIGNDKTTDSLNRKKLMDYLNQKENGQGLQASCIFAQDGHQTFKYTSIISRYSGKASLNMDEISPARMLRPGVSPEQKAQVEQHLNAVREQIEELQPKMDQVQEKFESLQRDGQEVQLKMKDAQKGKSDRNEVKNKLGSAKRKLASAEKEVSRDSADEKRRIRSNLRQNIKQYLSSLESASAHYDEYLKLSCEIAGIDMTEEGKRQMLANMNDKKVEAEMQFRQIEGEYARISEDYNRKRHELQQIKEEAQRIAPITDENGNDLPLKEELSKLPENLTELEEAMDDTREKINSIVDNPEVMRRYEQQKRQLEDMKDQLENLNENKAEKKNALKQKRRPWENALQNIVEKVSNLFSGYMEELGCAGEVQLAKGDELSKRGSTNEDSDENLGNFKDWGVQIKVKFRDKSDLQVLSAQVHSGGERSVSTIMYLMAMQNMMVSPFRCVDEINQGLDERNERLVFKRIVQNSTLPPEVEDDPTSHCGQYFLITPKLLPNLTDMENEDVTVHCIFNGPLNFKNFGDWNVDDFLESKKRMCKMEDSGSSKRLKQN
eukprot:CAMPEP_0203670242 /NCGR_PEP_ID=MMETSP0090-20130426/6384_1 /ASSEMBLY_ACC=CAM_ASM_001088 /TAXON_ID=426623 /ORGANISM="Chaetoceros affinis, Strain CCMP159" /LENGTH=1165 /DNA_ID=CAMNT_0050535065 /DNA_START=104 /DNA_END=3601 /DNA_ORIENTATION=+